MARPARVTTLSMSGVVGDGPDERIKRTTDAMLKAIDEVASDDPDIIVFTECLPYLGLSLKEQVEYAQPLDGWIVRSVAEKAKENKAYIICPIYQRKKDKVYNSSVLIDRNGEVLGVYNKHVPTIGEMEAGISPGIDTPVFQTDFGKISMVICFDLNFREAFIDPVEKGTEAFFFSSMFRGGALLSMRALEFGTYIISSCPGEYSAIVDMTGEVLAKTAIHYRYVTRELNFDRRLLHIDNNNRHWKDIKKKYGPGVTLDVISDEAVFALGSLMDDVSVDDIIAEYNLELVRDYFKRSLQVREEILRG